MRALLTLTRNSRDEVDAPLDNCDKVRVCLDLDVCQWAGRLGHFGQGTPSDSRTPTLPQFGKVPPDPGFDRLRSILTNSTLAGQILANGTIKCTKMSRNLSREPPTIENRCFP